MNVKSISRTVGLILLITGIFQLFPLLIAVIDHEPRNILAYIESLCLILLVGSALLLFSRGGNRMFSAQEGFAATGLSWIFMSAFGALPFFLSGQIPSYVDAFFEMVSGFTTTGASILTDVEALSRCNLFWRSFSHWLGGMGVLVFLLAVVPGARKNGGTGIYLMRAESPGPSVDKLTPHLRQTAMILYGIYILLTALCIVCLLLGGMPVFDSFCIAFGTAGTGGFAIKNSSMGGYSYFLQTVVTVFMFLFGVNFSLYYMLLLRKFKAVFKNEELRLYFGIAASSIVLIAINISCMYNTVYEAVHHAAFQVVSIMTTTGYGTVDFEQWPAFSKAILLSLMFIGASAGSTGGGLKVSRVLLLMKSIRRTIRKALHPRRVQPFIWTAAPSAKRSATTSTPISPFTASSSFSASPSSRWTAFPSVPISPPSRPASTTSAPALSLSAPHKISAFTAISRRLSSRSICSSADSRFSLSCSSSAPTPGAAEDNFCNKFARINCIRS